VVLSPEAKWASGIADDFWKAFLDDREQQAAGLLSPELSKSLTTFEQDAGANWRPLEMPASAALGRMSRQCGRGASVKTDAIVASPQHNEVVLKGYLTGKSGVDEKRTLSDFTMRIAQEGPGGRWSIRYLLITHREEDAKKKP